MSKRKRGIVSQAEKDAGDGGMTSSSAKRGKIVKPVEHFDKDGIVKRPTRSSARARDDGGKELEPEPSPRATSPTFSKIPAQSKRSQRSASSAKAEKNEEQGEEEKVIKKSSTNTRGSRGKKGSEEMPLAARTVGHKLYIGAHVSSAGGVHNAVLNSVHIGANAFALFLKSQRKWDNPPMADEHCTSFHSNCKAHDYDSNKHVVPHGSYLVNLAHTDEARTKQAYDTFLDDLRRCEALKIGLYNFHPGNTVGTDRIAAIRHLAHNLNRAHKETSSVVTLLENMAAGGNVLGSTFEDLRDIIALIDDKTRVGVCLDTCHAFAGGYDLRTPATFEATMQNFDEIVGLKYLHALHLNDSKAPFDSRRDLHANIGTGFLGLRSFHNIMNDARFHGLPMVLETPTESHDADGNPIKDSKGKIIEDKGIWAKEIKLLENLVGMDSEGAVFLELEKSLAQQGAPERGRLMKQQDRKKEKGAKQLKKKQEGKAGKSE